MPITTDNSAPLFAVVGATGVQGRSVVDALAAGPTHYRVRGFMRDTKKAGDLPSLGVEPVAVDLESASSLEKAFKDVQLAFVVTVPDFAAWPSTEAEERQGERLIDAAQAAGVGTLIFSCLYDIVARTNGKYTIQHFDSKANIAKYARSLNTPMNFKTVCPGNYVSNFWAAMAPQKQQDGSYLLALPMPRETQLPTVDMAHDFGRYVLAAAQSASPDQILAGGHYVSLEETANILSEFSGKSVVYKEIPAKDYHAGLANFVGPSLASAFTSMWEGVAAIGYYAGDSLEASNALLKTPPRSMLQALQANREAAGKVLA